LESFRRLLEKVEGQLLGGSWKACVTQGYLGYFYDVPGDEGDVFVLRLEMGSRTVPALRFMSLKRDNIAEIREE
jgi:hypothetical protein